MMINISNLINTVNSAVSGGMEAARAVVILLVQDTGMRYKH